MGTRALCTIASIGLAMALIAGVPARAGSSQTGAPAPPMRDVGAGKIISPLSGGLKAAPATLVHSDFPMHLGHCAAECDATNKKPENATKQHEDVADLARLGVPLISWIVAKTHWTDRGMPPVRFISQVQLMKMFTGGKPSALVAHSLYCEDNHTIFLPDTWTPDDLLDRSELLHELVHHLQYLNHVPETCPAESEWQAYRLQATWLREQGVEDPLALMGISPATIYMLSHCPEF